MSPSLSLNSPYSFSPLLSLPQLALLFFSPLSPSTRPTLLLLSSLSLNLPYSSPPLLSLPQLALLFSSPLSPSTRPTLLLLSSLSLNSPYPSSPLLSLPQLALLFFSSAHLFNNLPSGEHGPSPRERRWFSR